MLRSAEMRRQRQHWKRVAVEGLLRLGSFELHFEEGGEAIPRQEAGCSRKHLMKQMWSARQLGFSMAGGPVCEEPTAQPA